MLFVDLDTEVIDEVRSRPSSRAIFPPDAFVSSQGRSNGGSAGVALDRYQEEIGPNFEDQIRKRLEHCDNCEGV